MWNEKQVMKLTKSKQITRKKMKKHIILSLALLCQVLGVAAEDKVYISDFSIKAGETKRIELCFDTDRTDITRLQGMVTMPAGLTVQNQSDVAGTYVWITGNDARTGGALMSYNHATGSVMMTYGTFTAGTGAVAYIDVMASSSLAENSTITISGFKVMNNEKIYTDVTSENCTVTRDASGQGGEQSGEVSFAFSPESLTLEKGETATVDVTMTNDMALTGMQATLTASDGLTITGVTKGSRIVGQFRYNAATGIMVSLGSISGNEGTVFTVGLKVDEDFSGSSATLTISGLDVTNASAQDFPASDITLNVTVPVLELTLDEKEDNSQTLSANAGATANVTLTRTLQTGSYNTFSVPFEIPADKYSDYKLTGVKKLSTSAFDSETGVLTLTFAAETEGIEAGKPYLVKVSETVENPVFNGVTISSTATTTETDAADFIPTLGATTIAGDVKSILFLGGGNKLYNPDNKNSQMKGFRAYFLLKGDAAQQARAFRLDFGDGETTGIKAIDNFTISQSDNCYDLSGRKIVKSSNGKMAKGVYIVNGKKTIIK